MSEDEKKVITRLKQIQCSCEGIFYNFEAGVVLNIIEKQQKALENSVSKEALRGISNHIEYYLLGNLRYKDSQKAFEILLKNIKEILGE